jgi:hypothetical protein
MFIKQIILPEAAPDTISIEMNHLAPKSVKKRDHQANAPRKARTKYPIASTHSSTDWATIKSFKTTS